MHRYFLSILLTLCCTSYASAQNIDSLLKIIEQPDVHDTTRIITNNIISRKLSFIRPIEALSYTQKALDLSKKINYKRGIAESYRNLSSIYTYYGNYYLTVSNLQKAINGFKELKDSVGLANCYISMGHMYRYLRNVPQEIAYHKLSYDIFSKIGNRERIGVTAHNLGESYLNNNDLKQATELTTKAIFLNDSIQNIQVLSSCYKVMGKILMAENRLDEAEQYFTKIIRIYDSIKDDSQKIATIEALIQLATIQKFRQNISKKEYYLQKASEFLLNYKLTNYTAQVYLDLIELYTQTNRNDKAIEYTNKFRQVSDSLAKIDAEEKNQLVEGFSNLYEIEEQNSTLEIENNLKDERAKQKNAILYFIGCFAVVTMILLISFVRINKKIRNTNEQLAQKNMIIESQNEKLEELNHTKDKFFGIISHDLRAPLNSISAFTDFLASGNFHKLTGEQINELIAEAKILIDDARKLTDGLITWAQLQMKNEEARPELLNAEKTVKEVIAVFLTPAAKKNITIKDAIDPKQQVFADKNQFQFVIRNLINNAVKFTPEGGEILITGITTENNSSIIVTDTGTGMKKEVTATIFKAGKHRSKSGTAGETGSGLGLILVYEFVQLNKGDINVTSEPDKGSTFTVTFPASENQQIKSPHLSQAEQQHSFN